MLPTSEEYRITDYNLFEKGAISSNGMRADLATFIEKINEMKTKLKDQTILMGPASDNINEKIEKISSDYEIISNSYDKIAIRLTDIYEHYKKGDQEGANRIIGLCKTDSLGIPLNNISTSTGTPLGNSLATTANSTKAQEILDRAKSVLGSNYTSSGYRWTGDTSTSAFTCSGLIDYALGLPTNSNSPESLRDTIGVENLTTNPSEYKPGDIVFYEYYGAGHSSGWGHVGIYAGDGKVIDASTEAGSDNDGVRVRDVNWMPVLGVGTYPA